jgi:hypothetical protein
MQRRTTMSERIADAANIWDRVLLILERRGYALACEDYSSEGETWTVWIAERDGLRLEAENPISLLGLAQMREELGAKWREIDCGNVATRVVDRPPTR